MTQTLNERVVSSDLILIDCFGYIVNRLVYNSIVLHLASEQSIDVVPCNSTEYTTTLRETILIVGFLIIENLLKTTNEQA